MSNLIKYRPEIDGLRAVAVLSVIIFHLEFKVLGNSLLPGGFLGVDIFFVISGYLITSIILTEIEKGSFTFRNFYLRRAKRLLPALFIVLTTTSVASWLVLFPGEMKQYGQSLISSIFFYSNFNFWLEDPYFSGRSNLKPLLHTWSLSVEEQYYIIIPLLLVLLRRLLNSGKNVFFAILFFISFALAVLHTPTDPTSTFYLLPYRLWELMLGGLLSSIRINEKLHENVSSNLSMIGLIGIAFSVIFLSKNTLHPSFATLIPTLSTGLILVFASKNNLVGRILSQRIFVATGLISYGLYLWHFPIVSFSRLLELGFNQLLVKLSIVGISFIAAILSYRYVEFPIRNNKIKFVYSASLGFCLAIFMVIFSFKVDDTGAIQRYQNMFPNYENMVFDNRLLQLESWKYVRLKGQSFTDLQKTNVLLIGDSHSKDLFNAFHLNKELFPNAEFVRYGRDTKRDQNIECDAAQQFTNTELFSNSDIIVIDTYRNLLNKENKECLIEFTNKIKVTEKRLILVGEHILFKEIEQNNNWTRRLHKKTVVDELLLEKKLSQSDIPNLEMKQYELSKNNLGSDSDEYRKFAQDNNISFMDVTAFQCDYSTKSCSILDDVGHKIYYDNHHWTSEGAKFFGKKISRKYMKLFNK